MEFIEGTLTLLSHLLLRGQDKSFSNLYAETCPGTGKGGGKGWWGGGGGGVKWCRARGEGGCEVACVAGDPEEEG